MVDAMALRVKLTHPDAKLPTRGSLSAAGLDLYSVEKYRLAPGERRLIHTGVNVAVPSGFYGRVAPRSGLALKFGIDTLAGVVDSDYRGEVGVILLNTGTQNFPIEVGDRIAQLVIEAILTPPIVQVDDLDDTSRGEGGYGSTGA